MMNKRIFSLSNQRFFLLVVISASLPFLISLIAENSGYEAMEYRILVFLILTIPLFVICLILSLSHANIHFPLTNTDIVYGSFITLTIIFYLKVPYSFATIRQSIILLYILIVYLAFRYLSYNILFIKHNQYYYKIDRIVSAIIILVALITVAIGFYIEPLHYNFSGTFGNSNHYATYISLCIPILFSFIFPIGCNNTFIKPLKLLPILFFIILCSTLICTFCRGAMLAAGISIIIMLTVFLKDSHYVKSYNYRYVNSRICKFVFILMAVMFGYLIIRIFYYMKPLSSYGRILIWRVSLEMLKENFVMGINGNFFSSIYNLFQASYFATHPAIIQFRMAASSGTSAYNWFLKTTIQHGVLGLLILFLWISTVFCEIYKVLVRYKKMNLFHNNNKQEQNNPIYLGFVGTILCFFIMTLFYFPEKILCTNLLFLFALALVVSKNQQLEENKNNNSEVVIFCQKASESNNNNNKNYKQSYKMAGVKHYPHWKWSLLWAGILVASIILIPIEYNNYRMRQQNQKAFDMCISNKFAQAIPLYRDVLSKQNRNGRILANYGDCLLNIVQRQTFYTNKIKSLPQMATKNVGNVNIEKWVNSSYIKIIETYEKAKYTYPNPYLFENLSIAYLRLSIGTNWPVVLQTQYYMETTVQMIVRNIIECYQNTNMFHEYQQTILSHNDCIENAVNYLTLASNILPWRLTPKFYLADLFYQLGETNEAIKYARLVVNTPMKKWTERGKEFKLKSQKMLIELGEECDDPGLVVFDINDKKTWNEGLW